MFFQSVREYTLSMNHGVVFAFDTATDWEKIFKSKEGAKCLYSPLDQLEDLVTQDHLRFRVNPAIIGKKFSQLNDATLFLEVYDDHGQPVHARDVSGYPTVLPALTVPLDKSGFPLPFRTRYQDFHGRLWPLISVPLNSSNNVDIKVEADRLWLLSQFSDRVRTTDFFNDDVRLEVLLKNGDRYLVDSVGNVRGPHGELFGLTPRAFMFIADTLSKYLPRPPAQARKGH